ncbi:MAG: class II fructose-bisphosphate aldolase [Candidatus Doudnabacteria bacterium]
MLVHIKELFANKEQVVGKFAYPAFNTNNLETTIGIIAAAEELNTPVIIETSEGAIKYAGLETLYEIMASLAMKASVPIALHMDHGQDMDQLRRGIELGYSSAMIDHSHLTMEENIRDTKAMVEFAHKHGAWVQGEIGRIGGKEDWQEVKDDEVFLTTPEEAADFYEATKVDTLAGAFGTIHGIIKMNGTVEAKVDVERISQVAQAVPVPLVLHGGSGVPEDVVRKAIEAGITIVNTDTELRLAFTQGLRQALAENPDEVDPRKYLSPAIEALKQAAMIKLKMLKTQNVIQ